MRRGVIAGILLLVAVAIGGCASQRAGRAATADAPAAKSQTRAPYNGKVLVLGYPLPSGVGHEVIGPIQVFRRGYGSTGMAFHMLGDKARELGANAVVEASVWLAPAFPANVAPHGKGIAVVIKDPKVLEELSANNGRWE